MSKVPKRDLGFILHTFRNVILGREHNNALRFESECSERDGPPPQIPDGPAHKLSNNWYVNRDPRREVEPPIVLSQKLLPSNDASAQAATGERISGVPVPGKIYKWD